MFEQLITGPSGEPITVGDQAVFSRFDAPDAVIGSPAEDNPEYLLVQSYIGAGREQIERLTYYCYLPQSWRLTLDAFPRIYVGLEYYGRHFHLPSVWPFRPDAIELLRHPVQSVQHVYYIDMDGNQQDFSSDNWDLKNDRIILKPGKSWPVAARIPDAISIEYTAGYDPSGSPPTAIPQRLILALKFLSGWYYENRVPVTTVPTSEVQLTLSNLLIGFRSGYLAR